MSNAIGRIRTMGIAKQPTFGTPITTATFVLALLNAPTFQAEVTKIRNEAALGSSYGINELERGNRWSTIPLEFKIDEDQAPLMLAQRFQFTSTTASGDTNAFQHVGTHSNNTLCWYTLFLEDDNRTSYIMQDVLMQNTNFALDGEFVRVTADARGSFPTTWGGTNTVVQPKEFVGRMVNFNYANDGVTVTATNILSANANLTFGVNGDDSTHFLGDQDLATNELTQDEYVFEVTTLETNRLNYDDFTNNTAKQFDFTIESTDRFIAGTTVTRPFIQMSVPYAKLEGYSEDAPLDDLVKETFELLALDKVGEAGAPMTITVRNATTSY